MFGLEAEFTQKKATRLAHFG